MFPPPSFSIGETVLLADRVNREVSIFSGPQAWYPILANEPNGKRATIVGRHDGGHWYEVVLCRPSSPNISAGWANVYNLAEDNFLNRLLIRL